MNESNLSAPAPAPAPSPRPDAIARTDPLLGREWDATYGRQRITQCRRFTSGDLYTVTTLEDGGYRTYLAWQIEGVIKMDAHQMTPEYQAEAARQKALYAAIDAAREKARQDNFDQLAKLTEFTTAAGFSALKAGQCKKALMRFVEHEGVIQKSFEFVERLVARGNTTRTSLVDKIQPMSSTASDRADNDEQRAHERRIEQAGQKTIYHLGLYAVGAFEYAYANYLIAKKDSACLEAAGGWEQSSLAAIQANQDDGGLAA
jgi:hypothetical protein